RFLCGEPIRARPVGRAERLWRWALRNPALATVAGLLVVAVAAVAALSAAFMVYQARSLDQARRFSATLALARGLAQCEQGQVEVGMLWLARGLEAAPDDAAALQRVLRTNLAAWRRDLAALHDVLGHPGVVTAVAVSPDGKTLLTGCRDRTA